MFDIPARFFIDEQLIQALYDVYIRKDSNNADNQKDVTEELLKDKVLDFIANQEANDRLSDLVDELNRIAPKVFEIYNSLKKKKKANKVTTKKRINTAAATATTITTLSTSISASASISTYTEVARRNRVRDTVRALAVKATIRRRTIANA